MENTKQINTKNIELKKIFIKEFSEAGYEVNEWRYDETNASAEKEISFGANVSIQLRDGEFEMNCSSCRMSDEDFAKKAELLMQAVSLVKYVKEVAK